MPPEVVEQAPAAAPRRAPSPREVLTAIASIRVSIVALVLLMAVVLLCTFDQIKLGIHDAVNRDIRSIWIWATLPGTGFKLPVFPGGGFAGALLLANFLANYVLRFRIRGRHLALWLVHTGVVILIVGEFASAFLAVETQMAITEGQTLNYTESEREMELAATDLSNTQYDEVHAVPGHFLARGATFGRGNWPIELRVKDYLANARLVDIGAPGSGAGAAAATDTDPASAGVGRLVRPVRLARAHGDDEDNHPAAYVEGLGTWLVSPLISEAQTFVAGGHTWRLELRPRRYYLPFSIQLKDFRREMYPGTDIPKSFSSMVRVINPARHEDRDVLIYMNNPLRYAGLTFYQASYGQNDRLSVLQVVRNPGWLLPYIACGLAAIGMLAHFVVAFTDSRRVRT